MAKVLFISCTSAEFQNTAKDANSVYWLSDTKQLYKGEDLYSNNVSYVTEVPSFEDAIENMVYIVDNGSRKMQILVKGAEAMVPAGGTVDETDVAEAIAAALDSYKTAVVKVESKRSEDNSSTVISFTDHEGNVTDVTVADLFLSAANYDTETHILHLQVTGVDDPIEVDLSDLVPKAVDSSQVAIARNIVATVSVGNIKKGDIIDVANVQTVQDLFEAILSQDSNPEVIEPEATVVLTNAGPKEVGSKFTPYYKVKLTSGSYSETADGPQETGIVAKNVAITDTNGNTATTADGSFDQFTIADDTEYSVSADVSYDDGNIPKTYLGKEFEAGQIKGGTKSAKSDVVTGYRAGFWGTHDSKDGTLESKYIRRLGNTTTKAVVKGDQIAIAVPAGTLRVVLAYESSVGEVASIKSVEQLNSEIKSSFDLYKVQVNDASHVNPKEYNVYIKDLASAQVNATTYNVTI